MIESAHIQWYERYLHYHAVPIKAHVWVFFLIFPILVLLFKRCSQAITRPYAQKWATVTLNWYSNCVNMEWCLWWWLCKPMWLSVSHFHTKYTIGIWVLQLLLFFGHFHSNFYAIFRYFQKKILKPKEKPSETIGMAILNWIKNDMEISLSHLLSLGHSRKYSKQNPITWCATPNWIERSLHVKE